MYSYSFPPPQVYNIPPQAYYAQYQQPVKSNNYQQQTVPMYFYSTMPGMPVYPYSNTVQYQQPVKNNNYPQSETLYSNMPTSYPTQTPITIPPQNPMVSPSSKPPEKNVETSIWYINDAHGRLDGAKRLVTAAHKFDNDMKGKPIDAIKVSAGDIGIGADESKNNFMFDLLRIMNVDAATLGNHEFDMGTSALSKQIEKSPVDFTVTNINADASNPLSKHIHNNKISRVRIIEKNGNKYGILGTIPTDLKERLNAVAKGTAQDMSVDDIDQTIKELQQEADILKQQGVNKIILSSHMEDAENERIAKETSGIDVIISGHSHRLLEGVQEGKNLLYNKDGEPVVITQAGKDGKYYGVLDLTFDPDGKIIKVGNNVSETKEIPQSALANHFETVHMGPAQVLAKITNKVEAVSEELLAESAISDLIADAMRAKTGADVAFLNIGAARGSIGPGEITDRDIRELLPYENELKIFKYSEKDIIDALKGGVSSHVNKAHGPSALQVSGLRYKIDEDYDIEDVYIQQKDGSWKEIDVEDPSESTFYTVTYDSYLEGGPKYLEMMNCPDKMIKSSGCTTTNALVDYLKSFENKSFELKPAGRIEIEPKEEEKK